jgi:hypothetical protein
MESLLVLGLSVNTRMLGLAIISGSLIVDYHIQLRKDPWNPQKRESIITSLHSCCKSYTINSVALSIQHEKQTSKQTKELMESVTQYFKERQIQYFTYHIETLYVFCEENGAKTKKEIMKALSVLYPELLIHYQKEKDNKNKYYIKLFEAVGVATLHKN